MTEPIQPKELIVVKYGSESVTEAGSIRLDRIARSADQLHKLHNQYDLVVVTSGAAALGKSMWEEAKGRGAELDLQSQASLGNVELMSGWQRMLKTHGLLSGEVLLTHHQIDDRSREQGRDQADLHEGDIILGGLRKNLAAGIISIVNENDIASVKELKQLAYGGDNDGLARHLAQTLKAKHLCLITNKKGFLDTENKLVEYVAPYDIEQALALVRMIDKS